MKSWRERWFKLDALGYLHYYKGVNVRTFSAFAHDTTPHTHTIAHTHAHTHFS